MKPPLNLPLPGHVTVELDMERPTDRPWPQVDSLVVDNCPYVRQCPPSWTATSLDLRKEGDGSYQIERTWSVVDACGNAHSETQTITFEDNTAPTLQGETNVEVACGSYDESASYIEASQDYGSFDLTWETTETSGGCVQPVGQYARVYTATDVCGNLETFIQFITLVDEEAPQFSSFPGDVTANVVRRLCCFDTAAAEDIVLVEEREESGYVLARSM